MSGGPYGPTSAVPLNAGKVFPSLYVCAGANFKHIYGLGVMASVNADSIWRMAFVMPQTLPSGTCRLQLWSIANAATGAAKVNPKWAMGASLVNPSSITLVAEGTQTITWTAADTLVMTSIILDATTPQAAKFLLMDLTFETVGWTLAAVSCWLPYVEFV